MSLTILEGGVLTTVQDAGRHHWTHVGVPESGAADPWSFAVANLLVGNDPGAACLEMTLAGPTFAVGGPAEAMDRSPIWIALAGADLGGRIRGGRRLAVWRSHRLTSGDVVELPGDPAAGPASPARAYLAFAGGIDLPMVLGSRSTCLGAGFGGVDGRPLRAGDDVPISAATASGGVRAELAWPSADRPSGASVAELRVLATARAGLDALTGRVWRVSPAADRVGVRLDSTDDAGPLPDGIGGEALTHGVPWGAIQVPPDGRPIVLGPDHQTTGGYAVVGVVISADRPILGQLRPGAAVRLVATDQATARTALLAQRVALHAGAAAVREAAGWDAQIDAAGG